MYDPVALLHIIRLISCEIRSFFFLAILIWDGNRLLLHEPADSPICEESFSHVFIGQRWSHMVMIMSFDD